MLCALKWSITNEESILWALNFVKQRCEENVQKEIEFKKYLSSVEDKTAGRDVIKSLKYE